MEENLIKVGKYDTNLNNLLGLNLAELDIYRSKGLPTHMIKSKHYKSLKYIDYIPDIIESPDYIGINPNENGTKSIELIKKYKDNIIITSTIILRSEMVPDTLCKEYLRCWIHRPAKINVLLLFYLYDFLIIEK